MTTTTEATWIDAETQLPPLPENVTIFEQRVTVIAAFANGNVRAMRYAMGAMGIGSMRKRAGWQELDERSVYENPTHWMPMPKHPIQKIQEEI